VAAIVSLGEKSLVHGLGREIEGVRRRHPHTRHPAFRSYPRMTDIRATRCPHRDLHSSLDFAATAAMESYLKR
jgi:hypothetical protein